MSVDSEKLAIRRLAQRGYMLQDRKVWYIVDDDYDRGLEKNWVADWKDNAEDLYHALRSADWPTHHSEVQCAECREVDVFLGDLCPACSRRLTLEVKGDNVYDIRVGK